VLNLLNTVNSAHWQPEQARVGKHEEKVNPPIALKPSLAKALFLFAYTETPRTVFNKRARIYNFVFNALMLTICIAYYYLLYLPEIRR
jgi:hypothetical protein